MTIERSHMGGKNVFVGIRLDVEAKELLDWALVKVADPGDCVVAIHVYHNSDCISKQKALLDGYLKDYEGLCSKKQVALSGEVLKGNSTRKVLLSVAKNLRASAVLIVGINKHSALRHWALTAKYCAKRLPPTTEVMAIYNGKVVFSRCSKFLFEGPCLDPKPSFYLNDDPMLKDSPSDFGESEVSENINLSFDERDINSKDGVISPQNRKVSLSSISLPAEDFTKQRPGWPLLQTSSLVTQPALEARNLSVVQWVMALPQRNLVDVSVSNSPVSCDTDVSIKRENAKLAEVSGTDKFSSRQDLPNDLKAILMKKSAGCHVFSYDFLTKATSNFSSENLIGKGGCNSVYKGILPRGKSVAVKCMESSKEARKDFIQEIDILTTLKHKRVAPLLGVCVEDNDLISVYDFMPTGNLTDNLHGNRKGSSVISWEARFQIAVGIAEALNYLHNECQRPVIHRDVKSSNILLTEELEPQLCDFGLAIWGPTTASFVMDSDVVGTFGYLAPEYFMYGKVSDKMDVYSFGVVLLELLSGRKPIGLDTTERQESLVMWAKPMLESSDFKRILDPNLDGNYEEAQMQRMAIAAGICLTQAARLRPNMYQILNVLRGEGSLSIMKMNAKSLDDSDSEDEEEDDDEVYPDSSMESHLSIAFLDVKDESTSFRSSSSSSPLSVEEYLKKRFSRSPSME